MTVTDNRGSATSTDSTPAVIPKRQTWKSLLTSPKALVAYVFLAPYLFFFLAFRIIPALFGLVLSIADYSLAGELAFAGLKHFVRLVQDETFWNSVQVTVIYTVLTIPLAIILSLTMAQLCNRSLRGMALYRSLYFLPVVTSPVLSGIVFIWIFSADGPINAVLRIFGWDPGSWLLSQSLVLPALAMVAAWSNFGYDMLILLAGMLAIPESYYEAAKLDGAAAWSRFRHITLPLLKPSLFFVFVLETVKSFQAFDTIN